MTVACLMPTLPGREKFLARAIRSYEAQLNPADWEVKLYVDADPKPTLGAKLNKMTAARDEEYIRLCREFPSPAYLEYVSGLLHHAVVVDLTGTGRSLSLLLDRVGKPELPIYLLVQYGRRGSDHFVGSWTALRTAEQVVGSIQIPGHQDSSDDAHDPLASFVHEGIVRFSPFVRPVSNLGGKEGRLGASVFLWERQLRHSAVMRQSLIVVGRCACRGGTEGHHLK